MLDKLRLLRWGQIVVNVVIIVLSMCVCLPLGYVWKYFDSNCLLNADIYVQVSHNSTIQVMAEKTKWGEENQCLYTIFLPVVVATHSFVWTWFFVCLRIALKENGPDSYLTLPVVLFHGILCICMVVSSVIVSTGFDAWCASITRNLDKKYKFTCEDFQNMEWAMFKRKRNFYTFFVMGQVCSWLLTIAVASQCALTLYKSYYEWSWEMLTPETAKEPLGPGSGQCGPYHGPDSETASLTSSSRTSDHVPISPEKASLQSSTKSSRKSQVI